MPPPPPPLQLDVCQPQPQAVCVVEGRVSLPSGYPDERAAMLTLGDGRCLTLSLPAADWKTLSRSRVRLTGYRFKTLQGGPGLGFIDRYRVRNRWVGPQACASSEGLYVVKYHILPK